MSERREDQRPENEKLWDKTFEDDENVDSKGNLSRMKRRKEDSHNSRITTILVVIIIILAAAPIFFWVRHEQAFDHPARDERVTQTGPKRVASAKKASVHHRKTKRHTPKSSSMMSEASSTTNAGSESMATSATTNSSSSTMNNHDGQYATVQSGQGIYRVAVNNGLTVDELARLNNISPKTALQPGQRLRVK